MFPPKVCLSQYYLFYCKTSFAEGAPYALLLGHVALAAVAPVAQVDSTCEHQETCLSQQLPNECQKI